MFAGYITIIVLSAILYIDFLFLSVSFLLIFLLINLQKKNYYINIIYFGILVFLFLFEIITNNFYPAASMVQIIIGQYSLFLLLGFDFVEVMYFLGAVITAIVFLVYRKGYILIIGLGITSFYFMLNFIPLNNVVFYYYTILFFDIFSVLCWILYSITLMGDIVIEKLIEENKFTTVKI